MSRIDICTARRPPSRCHTHFNVLGRPQNVWLHPRRAHRGRHEPDHYFQHLHLRPPRHPPPPACDGGFFTSVLFPILHHVSRGDRMGGRPPICPAADGGGTVVGVDQRQRSIMKLTGKETRVRCRTIPPLRSQLNYFSRVVSSHFRRTLLRAISLPARENITDT